MSTTKWTRVAAALAVAAAQCVWDAGASATTPEEEAASLVFQEGYELFHAGRYEEALKRFEKASQVLRNKFILYYLGRTYAALDRCSQALPVLAPLAGQLGTDAKAREAEALRATDEAGCRLSLGVDLMATFHCEDSLGMLQGLSPAALPAALRDAAREVTGRAARCAAAFRTRSEAGRTAARLHTDAVAALERGEAARALEAAKASLAAEASDPARLAVGLALARLDRCVEAIPALEAAAPGVRPDEQAIHATALDGCRLSEARRLVDAADCAAALPLLRLLDGRLEGADEAWRKGKVAWCEPRSTAFLTDTTIRKAAHNLFLAARKARDAGDHEQARDRYAKALALVDEPIIRQELAAEHVATGACPAAANALAEVPESKRTARDRGILRACGDWMPTRELSGDDLSAYVDHIVEADRLRAAGDLEPALDRLAAAASLSANPAVVAARIDLLYEARGCEAWLAQADGAPAPIRDRLADVGPRKEACRPAPVVATDAGPDALPPAATEPDPLPTFDTTSLRTTSPRRDRRGLRITGWVAVSAGAALLGGAALGMVMHKDAVDRADSAAAIYDDPSADTATAWKAWSDWDAARSDASGWRRGTLALAGAGGGVAVTGLVLVLVSRRGGDGLAVRPYAAPRSLGLAGRF